MFIIYGPPNYAFLTQPFSCGSQEAAEVDLDQRLVQLHVLPDLQHAGHVKRGGGFFFSDEAVDVFLWEDLLGKSMGKDRKKSIIIHIS